MSNNIGWCDCTVNPDYRGQYVFGLPPDEIMVAEMRGIGDGLDATQRAANAAHIAANSPDVVKAHVDEILRLRAEVAAMRCRVCEGNIPTMRTCEELLNLSDRIETYNREFMRLESAAHWLVHNVREGCPPLPPEYLPDCDNENHPHNCASCWVEAARKIADGEFQK